jgi:hypothetical protein
MVVSDQQDLHRRLDQEMFFDLLTLVEPEALDYRKEIDPNEPLPSPRTSVTIGAIDVAYDHDPHQPPVVGTIAGGRDILLYADVPWFELAHKAEKSASFGLSLFGFGGDFGTSWSKSLLEEINKVAKRKPKTDSLDNLCNVRSETVSVVNNLHLFRLDRVPTEDQKNYLMRDVESRDWRPAFLTRSPNSPDPTNVAPHVVAYFAINGFVVSPEAWQMLPYPCRIFGNLVPVSVRTEFGNQLCHLRVRAAAVLARDQEVGFVPS